MEYTNTIKSNIMTYAWGASKEASKKFGGKAIEYLAESLRLTWKLVKNMKKQEEAEMTNEAKLEKYSELLEIGAINWKDKRIYLTEEVAKNLLGIEVEYHNRRVSAYKMDGEYVSRATAGHIFGTVKALYVDLYDGEIKGQQYDRENVIPEITEKVMELIKK